MPETGRMGRGRAAGVRHPQTNHPPNLGGSHHHIIERQESKVSHHRNRYLDRQARERATGRVEPVATSPGQEILARMTPPARTAPRKLSRREVRRMLTVIEDTEAMEG
jgi:hypothetical protein